MSFDAFCWFPKDSDKEPNVGGVQGETQDETYKKNKAFEIISFELGAENTISIGSFSSGGGAGKAQFKEFTVTKKTDRCSVGLFHGLVTGKHYEQMVVELRRAGETMTQTGGLFLKFEFRLVMIQDIAWSGSDGDDVPEETVIMQFGAVELTYIPQKKSGEKESKKAVTAWSRVLNKNILAVNDGV